MMMIDFQEPNADGETDVYMHRWSAVSAPNVVGTTGLNGCIGIAVLNDTRACAWVLHSPNMVHGDDESAACWRKHAR
jgi:chemotaxis receptor (MCP) glutamine deamidase CheD